MAQYALIGVLVLASVLQLVRKLMPGLSARVMRAMAGRLDRPGASRARRALGRALQPRAAAGQCGDGCSTCGSCGPKTPRRADGPVEEVVRFESRPPHQVP